MVILLFIIILSIAIGLISNTPTAMLFSVVYVVGASFVKLFNLKKSKVCVEIFSLLYLVGGLYMFLCFWYMTAHDYEWLLAYDTFFAFIPRIENYVYNGGNNIIRIIEIILDDYNFFDRTEYAYYIYSCVFAVIIKLISADLYLGLQISTLILFSLSGVVLFLICKQYGFNDKKSYSHTIVIFLLSIVFFYSSQILRDIHFMLCLLLAVYLSGKSHFSIFTLLELVIVIFVACNIRVETGLFLIITIPVYFLVAFHDQKRLPFTIMAFFVMIVIAIFLFLLYKNAVVSVFELNHEAYVEGIEESDGMINRFQRIPIIGDVFSIFYNASLPMPCWSRLDPSKNVEYGGNASNIMNIVRISATFINVCAYVCVFYYIFSQKLRATIRKQISLSHRYHIWIGFLYLYLQSAVISQRRLMGYYCVFYLLMFVILDNVSKSSRASIFRSAIGVFALLQIIGVLYFTM